MGTVLPPDKASMVVVGPDVHIVVPQSLYQQSGFAAVHLSVIARPAAFTPGSFLHYESAPADTDVPMSINSQTACMHTQNKSEMPARTLLWQCSPTAGPERIMSKSKLTSMHAHAYHRD